MSELSNRIGSNDVTGASDYDLAETLNVSLSLIDHGRAMNPYSTDRQLSAEERLVLVEDALLALATAVSRRLGL